MKKLFRNIIFAIFLVSLFTTLCFAQACVNKKSTGMIIGGGVHTCRRNPPVIDLLQVVTANLNPCAGGNTFTCSAWGTMECVANQPQCKANGGTLTLISVSTGMGAGGYQNIAGYYCINTNP